MRRLAAGLTVLWGTLACGQTDGLELGLPSRCDTVRRAGFTFCYSEEHEQAAWVAYTLTAAEVQAREAKRGKRPWERDPRVKTGSAEFSDYRNSGYDKGHLFPAADARWSEDAMRESFLLSNASPQVHEFNAGVWEATENAVRNFAVRHGAVYVVTGPVLRKGLPAIGRNRVSVPEYFYKVAMVLRGDTCRAIAFVCRNEPTMLPLERFIVAVDSVEALTGLDFFHALPDEIEHAAERATDVKWWLPNGGKLPRR